MAVERRIVVQGRVFFALLMREMTTRFGRSAGGYIWAVLEPAGTVALFVLVFSAITRHPPLGSSFPMFFATGYMAFHIYSDISRNVSNAIKVNRPLMSFPRVTILDAVLARFALQFLTATFVTILILSAIYAVDDVKLTIDFGPVFQALLLAALLGLGVGAINCVLFAYSQTWQRTFNLINRPMFIISGVFFLYESLPRAIREVIWWNPLIHITALMRKGFYPTYAAEFVSQTYVVFFALGPLMLGILFLRLLKAEVLDQ